MNHRKDIPEFDKFVVSSDVLLQPTIIDIDIKIIKIINIVLFILYPPIFYYLIMANLMPNIHKMT